MSRAWMPLYVGDYLRDTRDLTTLQHGAYLLLIMHYWQHGNLPGDEPRLAAIAGVSRGQWRRIREPIVAKFGDGWTHKRIDRELGKADRVFMQRRLAGRNGGIRSGIARAISRGEAIVAAQAHWQQAERKRPLERAGSGRSGVAVATAVSESKPPGTHHNHNEESSSGSASRIDADAALAPGQGAAESAGNEPPQKRASQWSRQELDALFARRHEATPGEGAPSEDTPGEAAPTSNEATGG